MATNSVSVQDRSIPLQYQCWRAFEERDYNEAIRLLPLVEEPKGIDLREYLDYYSWSTKYSRRANLLHLSSRNGWLDVTKELITNYQFDPREGDARGNTCLHYAAEGNQVDIVRYLVNECNCDPMATDSSKWTVLHHAADYGSTDVIKYLINECNCDLMACTVDGETPLHWAALWGGSAVVELLLSTGKCDPLAKDNEGITPLQMASGGTRLIFKKFGQIKTSHPVDSYVNVLAPTG